MLIFEILLAIENEEERTLVEGIYLDYYGRMLQICHQILRHPQDSEDAAMNAMKRIAENSKKFSGKDRNEIISLVVIYTRNAALTRTTTKGNAGIRFRLQWNLLNYPKPAKWIYRMKVRIFKELSSIAKQYI